MRIEFIGTGNAHGTPTAGCGCSVCREAQINLERRRRSPCIAVSTSDDQASLVIDAGDPAVNNWLERPATLGVLLSHFHPGHFHALLAHRRSHGTTPVYCPPDNTGPESLAINAKALELLHLSPYSPVEIGPFEITPVLLNHNLITFGYCIESEGQRLAYLCDTCGLPPQTTQFLEEWKPDGVIIDCNQHPRAPKPTHNTPKEALKIHRSIKPRRSYLTHISCRADSYLTPKPKTFPNNVEIARDGMVVDLDPSVKKIPSAYV